MSDKDTERFEAEAQKYAQVLAKIWSDDEFAASFKADPRKVMKENGIDIPEERKIVVVEDTPDVLHLVIPPKPEGLEKLSEDDLEDAAGGRCGCARCAGCAARCAGCFHPVARGAVGGAIVGGAIASAADDDDDDW
jgi:nitrile hydratase alpha subunit